MKAEADFRTLGTRLPLASSCPGLCGCLCSLWSSAAADLTEENKSAGQQAAALTVSQLLAGGQQANMLCVSLLMMSLTLCCCPRKTKQACVLGVMFAFQETGRATRLVWPADHSECRVEASLSCVPVSAPRMPLHDHLPKESAAATATCHDRSL